jgi:hypothetical protein
MSALLGVATGNMNAKLTERIRGNNKYTGLIFNSIAFCEK